MNWLALIAAFAISLLAGGFLSRLLERSRPTWSAARRKWVAAMVLPGFVLVVTVVGIFVTIGIGPGSGENMQDLAVIATATVGLVFAIIALVGGLIGASFASRRGDG
jgi:hypothetical protein